MYPDSAQEKLILTALGPLELLGSYLTTYREALMEEMKAVLSKVIPAALDELEGRTDGTHFDIITVWRVPCYAFDH